MPAPRRLPSDEILRRWVEDEGLTHQQVADRILEREGVEVGRSAVSAALTRAGYTHPKRFSDTIPWKVEKQHQDTIHHWMLRVHHKITHDIPVRDVERERHASWLARLQEHDAVIAYEPNSEHGFYPVRRQSGDTDVIHPPADGPRPDSRDPAVARRAATHSTRTPRPPDPLFSNEGGR